MDALALEKLISDLNDCELYARAHNQESSLDSSFILNVGERLLSYFKNPSFETSVGAELNGDQQKEFREV